MTTEDIVEADPYWSNKIKLYKQISYQCVNCGLTYQEATNIGRLKCFSHAHFPSVNIGEIWPCCGKKAIGKPWPLNYGCVKSDHTILNCPYDESHNIPLPKYVAEKIGVKTWFESVIKVDSEYDSEEYRDEQDMVDTKSNYIKIRRYDIKTKIKNGD